MTPDWCAVGLAPIIFVVMSAPPIVTHGGAAGDQILCQECELAMLDELLDRVPERGAALFVRGRRASASPPWLRRRAGAPRRRGCGFCARPGYSLRRGCRSQGCSNLVLPVLGRADQLPRPQQDALLAASGMMEVAAPDCFLIALAVLELLSEIAEHAPLLIVADGAQWLDRSSAEVLAFVIRQSQTELLKTQLFLIEVPHCRPMEDLALNGEARAVARAVPARLRRVPGDNATQVRATRRDGVDLALRVPVDGGLVARASHNSALPGRDIGLVACAAEAVPYEVCGLLQALCESLIARQGCHPGRVVKSGLLVLFPGDEVGEEYRRGRTVGHAPGREGGGDVDVLGAGPDPADKGQPLHRVVVLGGPAVLEPRDPKPFPSPLLEVPVPPLRVPLLASLMGLADHDEHSLSVPVAGAYGARGRARADGYTLRGHRLSNPRRDPVLALGGGLAPELALEQKRDVRSHDDVPGDYPPSVRLYPALYAFFDAQRAGVLEEVAVASRYLIGQRQEVLADVELRLVLEPDRPLDRERERDVPREGGRQTHPPRRFDFSLELGQHVGGLGVRVGWQAPESAVNALLIYERLNAVDGGLVRFRVEASLLQAVAVYERVVGQLVLGGDLRCRVARDALGYPSRLDQDHPLARPL